MGYEDPVGRTLTLENRKGMIIGVFSGFRTLDLAGPETPTIIRITKENRGNLLVKLEGDYSSLSGRIRDVTGRYVHEKPLQQMLYSDLIARTELSTVSNLVGLAFLVSILLACMGLSGLAAFTAARRTKEIGIRKINGATTGTIMQLLGINFSRWLAIASAISIPLAFLVGNIFLSRFSVRTPFPYWAFLVGPAIAYIIALITVSRQSWKASARNPVEALRYE
jgi:putative ABC transport system permease protein